MDPAGTGALIGIGIMALCCASMKMYDVIEKRKSKTSVTTPLLVSLPPPHVIKTRSHWKVNNLFKNEKKTILLKNLNSMSASRSLTTISIKQ